MLFVRFLRVCSTEMHRAKHFLNISKDPLSLIFHRTSTVTTLDLLKTSSLQTKHSLSFPVAPNTQVNQLFLSRYAVWCHSEGVTLKLSSRGRVIRLVRKIASADSSGNPSVNFSELEATSANELFCQSNSTQNKHIPHIREEKKPKMIKFLTTEWLKWLIDCQTASSFVFLSLINTVKQQCLAPGRTTGQPHPSSI